VPGLVDGDSAGHLVAPGVPIPSAPAGARRSSSVDLGAYNGVVLSSSRPGEE
jgi:hypothetical protein